MEGHEKNHRDVRRARGGNFEMVYYIKNQDLLDLSVLPLQRRVVL